MTTPPQPFTNPLDFDRVLATLSEPILLAVIREKSLARALPWLERMTAIGLFDLPALPATTDRVKLADACVDWLHRCEALLHVMAGGVFEPDLRFRYTPQELTFFANVFDKIHADAKRIHAHPSGGGGYLYERVMAKTIAAACLFDLTPAVLRMIEDFPNALTNEFRMDFLGGPMMHRAIVPGEKKVSHVNALFCALEYNKIACVQAILAAEPDEAFYPACLGTFYDGKQNLKLNALASFSVVVHHCSAEAYSLVLAPAIAGLKGDEKKMKELHQDALALLQQQEDFEVNKHLLPALLANAVYDIDPVASICTAIAQGNLEVLKHFESAMPWDALERIFGAPQCPMTEAVRENHPQTVLRVFDLAQKDARMDACMAAFVNAESNEPLYLMTESLAMSPAALPVLLKALDYGLQPHAIVESTVKTFLEWIDGDNTAYGMAIRSYLARIHARDTLEKIELPP